MHLQRYIRTFGKTVVPLNPLSELSLEAKISAGLIGVSSFRDAAWGGEESEKNDPQYFFDPVRKSGS